MKNNKIQIFLELLVFNTKVKIKELAHLELDNKNKKQKLDNYIVKMIKETENNLGFNFVTRYVVDNYLIPYIDDITQYIYELLKSRIDSKDADNSVKISVKPINEV